MILPIQTGKHNPILRKKAALVKEITPEIRQLILDMLETLKSSDNNIGLAAPQVNRSLRIIAFQPATNQSAQTLINPIILRQSEKTSIMEEGCLSLPDYTAKIKRPIKATIQATDLEGKKIKIKAKHIIARIIQHEIDHLEGTLICDKASSA